MSSLVTADRFRGTTTDPNVFYYEDMVVYNQMYNHMCKFITLSVYVHILFCLQIGRQKDFNFFTKFTRCAKLAIIIFFTNVFCKISL